MNRMSRPWAVISPIAMLVAMGCEADEALVGEDAASDRTELEGGSGPTEITTSFDELLPGGADSQCLPRLLPTDPDGTASCRLVQVSQAAIDCASPGRMPTAPEVAAAALDAVERTGFCGDAGPRCSDVFLCELRQLTDGDSLDERTRCLAGDATATSAGWCYVDPDAGLGDPSLVADCGLGQPPLRIRLIGEDLLPESDRGVVLCSGTMRLETVAHLGDPCVTQDERSSQFSGHSPADVSVEMASPACESQVCLVNHFQGRASCLYGQTMDDLAAGEPKCSVPASNVPIAVPVPPAMVERPPSSASICSCRCSGPGAGPFCTCPDSMECAPLIDDLGLGGDDVAGSYCIPRGTAYDPLTITPLQCDRTLMDCGDEPPFPP